MAEGRETPAREAGGEKASPTGLRSDQAPSASGGVSPGHAVLALQRAAGNRAVAALLGNGGPRQAGGGTAGGGDGGGGGGAALRPSTLAADISGIAAAASAAQDRAGAEASTLLAAAGTPQGPPVASPADVPDAPQPPAVAVATRQPPGPAQADDSIDVDSTTAGLAAHEQDESAGVLAAGAEAARHARSVTIGDLGPSRTVGDVTGSSAGVGQPAGGMRDTAAAVDAPDLEPEVARVLDSGFGPQLSAKAAAAARRQEEALAEHDRIGQEARRTHDDTLATEQAAAGNRERAVRQQATADIGGHKAAWAAEGSRLATAGRSQLQSLRQGATADVERESGQANTEAGSILSTARREALQMQVGEQVQRSFWSRARDVAGGLVRSVRDGASALAGAARRTLDAALDRARGLFNRAREAITQRVNRFVQAARSVAERVRDGLAEVGRRAVSAIRNVVALARRTLDQVVAGLRAVGARLWNGLTSALRRAASWLGQKLRGLVDGLIAAGRAVLAFAGRVRQLLAVLGNKTIKGVARAIEDPAAFVAPYRAQVAQMIATAPDKARSLYDEHVAPLLGGGGPAPAAAGPVAGERNVQRQHHDGGEQTTTEAVPSHGDILWEYLKARLSYLGSNWGSVIIDVLLEIFVPFVSMYRHVPPMVKAVWQAVQDLMAGRVSDAIDQGLKAARELMALLSTLFAQFAIVAFIVGSIIGTPIVGAGAMMAIGLTLLAADTVVQVASIAKAWSNVQRPDRTVEQLDEDYGTMADSLLGLAVTYALLLIASVGQKLGKALIAKFPRAGAALATLRESLRARARRALGLGTPPTRGPVVDTPNAPAATPEVTGFPGRAGLNPVEQRAFDRAVTARRANGTMTPEFEARLQAATPHELRRIFRQDFAAQPDIERAQAARDRAQATNTSDPLDPVMANTRDEGGGVRSRWNESPPSGAEIQQARQISAATGEPIELFGDAYRGIDGTIGRPPRPLQLKGIPQSGPAGAAEVYRSAVVARDKAVRFGFREVEVRITAPNVSRAELAAEFARPTSPGVYLDGNGVRRVVIHGSDGVYIPPSTPVVTPPIHIDERPPGAGEPGGDESGAPDLVGSR